MPDQDFTEAARAEAERRNPSNAPKGLTRASNAISRRDFRDGAEWARTHFAENGYGPMTTEKVREWTGAWPAEQRAEQPRALTADAIESVLHDILPLTTERLEGDDIADIAFDLHAALTEPPTRPETEDQT